VNTIVDPIQAFRLELRTAARRRIATRRRRGVALLVALAAGALVSGLSLAGTGWLTGEPAPEPVVRDFEAYTPKLGFHPEPGKAVLVAEDGPVKLYATTNREGTYCYVTDTPWKHPEVHDGGTCIPPELPTGPISAGIVALSRDAAQETYVVGGRVAAPAARSIRFSTPTGDSIEQPIGTSGFYVAAFTTTAMCANWEPTLTALNAEGEEVARTTIRLESQTSPHTCLFEGLPVARSRF